MKARSTLSLLTLAAGVFLAGCSSDSTSPASVQPRAVSQFRASPFVPTAAAKALVGVADGTYEFTVDPTVDQAINLGPNHLDLPAGSICDLETSSYGASFWNDSCAAETEPVRVTAIVRNATTDHPSIDFYPAMRFSPAKNVNLYIYVPVGMEAFEKSWVMNYCNDDNVCVDESLTDSSLNSQADVENKMVFRRVKHFSGFIIASGIAEGLGETLGGALGF